MNLEASRSCQYSSHENRLIIQVAKAHCAIIGGAFSALKCLWGYFRFKIQKL